MAGITPDTTCSRVWVVATTDGESVRGYLPAWAEDDPSATDVGPERLHLQLTDIQHQAHLGGPRATRG